MQAQAVPISLGLFPLLFLLSGSLFLGRGFLVFHLCLRVWGWAVRGGSWG